MKQKQDGNFAKLGHDQPCSDVGNSGIIEADLGKVGEGGNGLSDFTMMMSRSTRYAHSQEGGRERHSSSSPA